MDRRLLLMMIAGGVAFPKMTGSMPKAPWAPPPAIPELPPSASLESPPPASPPPPAEPPSALVSRRLRLSNPHTGETFQGTYRNDNGPIPEVMDELSVFLRDFRSGEQIGIDVAVIDFLASVMDAAGQTEATILSAYRTAETNAALAKTNFGVAENSQHIYGRALDIHFGGKLTDAMKAARAMQRGGVGWYPHSSFMHIDSGPVRNWDLDHVGLGTLLIGGRRVRFNKKGDLLVSARGKTVVIPGKTEIPGKGTVAALRGGAPTNVRQRLTLLRQLAQASLRVRRM
jgi:uncharacterized protein YcbK (DUF882 family)